MSRRRKRLKEKEIRHSRKRRAQVTAGAGLGLSAAFALAPAAQAADFIVDDSTDTNVGMCADPAPVPADCSLRDAITQANADGVADRILFHSSVTGAIVLTGQLSIDYPLEVVGPGAGALTVSGDGNYRIFDIDSPGAVTISGLTLTDGYVYNDAGGAIRSEDTDLTINDSVITDSVAYSYGGMPPVAVGGGIAALNVVDGSLTVQRSVLSGNHAAADIAVGGGISAKYGSLSVTDSVLSDNYLTGSPISIGAGIQTKYASVAIQRSTISGGTADTQGDGFGAGGGLSTKYSYGVLIDRSTVSGNQSSVFGGGVFSYEEDLRVLNSTVSGNTTSYAGGGIYSDADSQGTVELTNSTVAGNSATDGGSAGGGLFLCNCVAGTINNTILADNTATDGPDVYLSGGSPPSTAFSLIEGPIGGGTINETVAGSNKLGVDPQLGPLAANGGPTQTQALPMGSPAVDAGSNFGAGIDQRGESRPFDLMSVPNSLAAGANGTDMGAFELHGPNAAAGEGPGCQGKPATIVAQPGVNTVGTSGDDVIIGTRGPDNVDAGAGNDTICLFDGDDFTKGGAGNDLVLAGPDADKVKGGAGDDKLRGRGGRDRLSGKGGDDRIRGGHGNDVLTGGPGNDRMRGGAGDDIVDGKFEEDGKRHGGGGDDDRGGGKHGSKG